ncbi:MAG: 3-phosphoshikimate 1-carboxyvinyltransferase [Pseudomonadota bacterium]
MPEQLKIDPVREVSGEITLPGSKSLSNRALLLAALASGTTRLSNLLRSEDTARMIEALEQLGVGLQLDAAGQTATITGNDGLFEPPANTHFFLGNAGTAIRPLTAVLSLVPGVFRIDGDQYMHERPIDHLIDALVKLGAEARYLGKPGCPPLELTGGKVRGGATELPGNISSQFLTALLLALPLAERDSTITVIGEQVSKPYLDLTLSIMQQFGVHASHDNYQQFHVAAGQQYRSPGHYLIEGDASSASYFFAAAAIKGGRVRVHGLGVNSVQGDIQFLDVLEAMGAVVKRNETWVDVSRGQLRGIDMDMNHIPDAAMTIATLALFAEGPTRIRNIYNWRVKETDRMTAMATELQKLGAGVETGADYIVISPPDQIRSAEIDTYGDHRIAMAFSLAALGNTSITINNPECTAKTFPDYFEVFESVCQR